MPTQSTKRRRKLQRTKAQTTKVRKQAKTKEVMTSSDTLDIDLGKKLKVEKGEKELTPSMSKQIVDDLQLSGRGLPNDGVVESTVPKARELPKDDVGHDMDIDDLDNIVDEVIQKSKSAVKKFKEGQTELLVNKVLKATNSEIVSPVVITVLLNKKLQDNTPIERGPNDEFIERL